MFYCLAPHIRLFALTLPILALTGCGTEKGQKASIFSVDDLDRQLGAYDVGLLVQNCSQAELAVRQAVARAFDDMRVSALNEETPFSAVLAAARARVSESASSRRPALQKVVEDSERMDAARNRTLTRSWTLYLDETAPGQVERQAAVREEVRRLGMQCEALIHTVAKAAK